MKNYLFAFIIICSVSSCNHDNKIIVNTTYVDSLINHYTQPAVIANESDLEFWKNRIDPANPGFTNEIKYSGALAARFALKGDIHDLTTADSTLRVISKTYNDKEASPYLALLAHSISQHKFNEADILFK